MTARATPGRVARAAARTFAAAFMAMFVGCASTPMYAPCDESRDCEAPADRCVRLRFTRSDGSEGDGTLCSKRCTSDDDCPGAGRCLALAGDPNATFLCVESCTGDSCFVGHACTPVEGAPGGDVCLPD